LHDNKESFIQFLSHDKAALNQHLQTLSERLLSNQSTKNDDVFRLNSAINSHQTAANDNQSKALKKQTKQAIHKAKQTLKASRAVLTNHLSELLNIKSIADQITQESNDLQLLKKRLPSYAKKGLPMSIKPGQFGTNIMQPLSK